MLQDEIGSIMKYCYGINPVTIYMDTIPQSFKIPSMYFPVPFVISSGDTFSSYRNSYRLFVKVFEKTTQKAHAKAHVIAEGIRKARCIIPAVSQAGVLTGEYLRLSNNIETQVPDEGIAELTLKWDSRHPYDREIYEKMGALFIDSVIK